MPINEHPKRGSIVSCDFNQGFKVPEMVKKRIVIVLSKKILNRHKLCTVVPLSTTPPDKLMPYHCQLDIRPKLPHWMDSDGVWVKGDMVHAVGFHRMNLIRVREKGVKRQYYYNTLSESQMRRVERCILHGIGLSHLTPHI